MPILVLNVDALNAHVGSFISRRNYFPPSIRPLAWNEWGVEGASKNQYWHESLGFKPEALPGLLKEFYASPVEVVGVFSHLAAADDPSKDSFTKQQLAVFEEVSAQVKAQYPAAISHILNTHGIHRFGGTQRHGTIGYWSVRCRSNKHRAARSDCMKVRLVKSPT